MKYYAPGQTISKIISTVNKIEFPGYSNKKVVFGEKKMFSRFSFKNRLKILIVKL